MKFKNWRIWVRSKPWMLKWFIILILIRPVIDNFYFLKDVSPFLSPLNWVGVLTPILCIPAIIQYNYHNNRLNQLFNIWSVLILLNTFFLLFQEVEFLNLSQWMLKLSIPVYLFAFLRIFIRNKIDLTGILTTFLYSCVIASFILLYELLFKPITVEYSRGIERLQGGYADVMNYAIYLSFGFLIISYFYYSYKLTRSGLKISLPLLLAVGFFCIAGFTSISHAVSYAVFSALLLLFIYYVARKYSLISLVIIGIVWIMFSTYGDKFYQERINPLMEKEIEVIRGEREQSQLFHGRMYRWQYAWDHFKDSPVISWVIGYPSSFEDPFFNISIGIHNDFLRIFYFTGLAGLLIYFLFIYRLWRKRKFLFLDEKFLLNGSLLILLLYSVTTTPTYYPNFLYILLPVFVYYSLPAPLLAQYATKQGTYSW